MIDVIWWDASRGNWDSGLICSVLDKYPEIFIQHNSKELIYPKRAIVILVNKPKTGPLKEYLNKLHCIFDITKSMVEVSGNKLSEKKESVFLSFAAENNIVYCWNVKSKVQNNKETMH